MANESKTKYFTFTGKAQWAKLYKPDEFRGSVKWCLDLIMDDPAEWVKFKEAGIQKKVKEGAEGKYVQFARSTSKLMKGRVVYFAPPIILDKDGKPIVSYVDSFGSPVRSYEDEKARPERVGEPILIGNGSVVQVSVSVYPTAMGPGNRLESVKVLDLVAYEEEKEKSPETKEDEVKAPW